MSRKVQDLRMVLLFACNNHCKNAIADTVSEDASQVLIDLRVWGCTLFVYLKNDVPQRQAIGEGL